MDGCDGDEENCDEDGSLRKSPPKNPADEPETARIRHNAGKPDPEMKWQMRVVGHPEQEAQDVKHGRWMVEVGRDRVEIGAEVTGPKAEAFVRVDVVGPVGLESQQEFGEESETRKQNDRYATAIGNRCTGFKLFCLCAPQCFILGHLTIASSYGSGITRLSPRVPHCHK